MPFYKHVHSQHIDKVLKGSLRFSSLDYFRHIEIDKNDTETGDKLEGSVETALDEMIVDGGPTERQREVAKKVKIGLSEGMTGSGTIRNVKIITHCGHWHIFSFSEVDSYEERNACLEFESVEELTQRVLKGTIGGAPVSDYFDDHLVGKIDYLKREASAWDVETELAASPLAKRPSYAHQREWRIALRAKDEFLGDIVYIDIDVSPDVLKEVRRSATEDASSEAPPSAEEVAKEIVQLLGEIQTFEDKAADAFLRSHSGRSYIEDEKESVAEHKRVSEIVNRDLAKLEEEFAQSFPWPKIKELYWTARLLGVRGPWDSSLNVADRKGFAHLIHDLGRLAHRLSPGCLPERYDELANWDRPRGANP
jgi:hypothetical protein